MEGSYRNGGIYQCTEPQTNGTSRDWDNHSTQNPTKITREDKKLIQRFSTFYELVVSIVEMDLTVPNHCSNPKYLIEKRNFYFIDKTFTLRSDFFHIGSGRTAIFLTKKKFEMNYWTKVKTGYFPFKIFVWFTQNNLWEV